MKGDSLISWLLQGDVSIQYQTYRDLLGEERPDLQRRIETEGWGAKFLSYQHKNGHWGRGFYFPKWTSSHYTLLDLCNIGLAPGNPAAMKAINKIADEEKSYDGGVHPSHTPSDACVNGMFLNFGCYFGIDEEKLHSIVDFILSQKMSDGGFNCMKNRSGAVHSSLHSTLSMLEGFEEYFRNGYSYRKEELEKLKKSCIEFILMHRLYKSDHTGEIIHKDFLKMVNPSRWKYNVLRAMDYFQYANVPWNERMSDAMEYLLSKRNKDGTWNVQAKHSGELHVEMEKAGKPSRWNTLRMLRIMRNYDRLR